MFRDTITSFQRSLVNKKLMLLELYKSYKIFRGYELKLVSYILCFSAKT